MAVSLSTTESLCPFCLTRLPASITADADGVFLEKECPRHGSFRTIIWRGSTESYEAWIHDSGPCGESLPSGPHCEDRDGCPFDCGLCAEHIGESCSAALMVTSRCNLHCPVCFTRGENKTVYEPSPHELRDMLLFYRETSGAAFPLEMCGGEPTVRDDLPAIVEMARNLGFGHIQINSNGLRLAQDPELAKRLKDAGATVIYLGFDGAEDKPYEITSGRKLFDLKSLAVEHCAEASLAVVLVPVLIPGVNTDQVGAIVERAKSWVPAVKGVYFQPVSYFGDYPYSPQNEDRLTIPDVIKMLTEQTGGLIAESDFMPPGCEHPLCSFHAFYMLDRDGRAKAITRRHTRTDNNGSADRVRAVTAKQWRPSKARTLAVGGMLFQDVWSVDLERLRRCIIHIIGKNQRLIPLCTKYLTSRDGRRIYPGLA